MQLISPFQYTGGSPLCACEMGSCILGSPLSDTVASSFLKYPCYHLSKYVSVRTETKWQQEHVIVRPFLNLPTIWPNKSSGQDKNQSMTHRIIIIQYLLLANQLDPVQWVSKPTHSSINSKFMMNFYSALFSKHPFQMRWKSNIPAIKLDLHPLRCSLSSFFIWSFSQDHITVYQTQMKSGLMHIKAMSFCS